MPGPAFSVYHPFEQEIGGGRLFVHASGDPYALVPPITKIIRALSPDQPVEQAATLDDIRAEVLAPERLNALVFGGFAAVALMIAVVGVAGVLAFSVSARTREFGIRLAVGSAPRQLLTKVLSRRRGDRRRRYRARRGGRARAGQGAGQLPAGHGDAGRGAARGGRAAAGGGSRRGIAGAGVARLADRRDRGAAGRVAVRASLDSAAPICYSLRLIMSRASALFTAGMLTIVGLLGCGPCRSFE